MPSRVVACILAVLTWLGSSMSNVSLLDVVPRLTNAVEEAQDCYRADCPYCGARDTLAVDGRSFRCFNPECDTVGNLVALLNRVSGLATPDDVPVFATLADLLARPELLTPPECVIPRLAYRGRLVILAGPDKSGKSTLLAHATAALSRGDRFLGDPIGARHHRGVVLGLEEAVGDGVRRFAELGAEPHRIQLVVIQEPDLLTRTKTLLKAWPADLVVVDSLSEYARVTQGAVPEDGDTGAWAGVVRPLVSLARDCDVAVVVLHHVRRSDGQYRGSGEIAAAADAVLELAVPKPGEDPTVRKISGRGRWAVSPFEVTLRDGRYELGGGAPLSLDARIILHVEQSPGMSGAQIRKAVGGRGTAVDEAVRNLVARGALDERTDGRGSSFYPPSGQGELGVA